MQRVRSHRRHDASHAIRLRYWQIKFADSLLHESEQILFRLVQTVANQLRIVYTPQTGTRDSTRQLSRVGVARQCVIGHKHKEANVLFPNLFQFKAIAGSIDTVSQSKFVWSSFVPASSSGRQHTPTRNTSVDPKCQYVLYTIFHVWPRDLCWLSI